MIRNRRAGPGAPVSVEQQLVSLILALQILTRFPLPAPTASSVQDLGRSIVWFPVVGAIIGLALVMLDRGAGQLFAPPLASALVVFGLVAITGAFHLDGLIDTADGLLAGPTSEARLEAMRLSVAGVPGAVAGCIMVFTTYAAVLNLPATIREMALVLAPLCGRLAILVGYWRLPYGRSEAGLSMALKIGATTRRSVPGVAMALGLAAIVGQMGGLTAALAAIGLALGLGYLALRRLPGLTGDTHGAICEVTQLGVLLAAPALLA